MFNSLKNLIDLRLGQSFIVDERIHEHGYFIKIKKEHLDILIAFLKTDPDLRLNFLDNISILPGGIFFEPTHKDIDFLIFYQLKSIKLPYRVGIIIDINSKNDSIISIAKHFWAARWLEEDIMKKYGINIDDSLGLNL